MALNVLVVDDSAVMRKMIIKILKESGLLICDIHEAENGQKGLEALDKFDVDFVLLDVNMPVMNGEEMLDKVRTNPKTERLPVIFISSECNENRIQLLVSKGSKYIAKPFQSKLLGQTVKNMLGELNANPKK